MVSYVALGGVLCDIWSLATHVSAQPVVEGSGAEPGAPPERESVAYGGDPAAWILSLADSIGHL